MPCGLGELCVIQTQNRGKPSKDHRKPILAGHKITDKNISYVVGCFGTSDVQVGAKMCTECARKMRKYRSETSSPDDASSLSAPHQQITKPTASALGNGGARRSAAAPSWARVDDYVFEDQLRLMLDPTRDQQDPEAFSFTLDSIIRPSATHVIAASQPASLSSSPNACLPPMRQVQSQQTSPALSPPLPVPQAAVAVATQQPQLTHPMLMKSGASPMMQPRRTLKAEHHVQPALLSVLADAASRLQSNDRTSRVQAARSVLVRNFPTSDDFSPASESILLQQQQQQQQPQIHVLSPPQLTSQHMPQLVCSLQQHPHSYANSPDSTLDFRQNPSPYMVPSSVRTYAAPSTTVAPLVDSQPPQHALHHTRPTLPSQPYPHQSQQSLMIAQQFQQQQQQLQAMMAQQQQQQQRLHSQNNNWPPAVRTEVYAEPLIQLPPLQHPTQQQQQQQQIGFLLPPPSMLSSQRFPTQLQPPQPQPLQPLQPLQPQTQPQMRQQGPLPSIQQVLNFAFSPTPTPRLLRGAPVPIPMARFSTSHEFQ